MTTLLYYLLLVSIALVYVSSQEDDEPPLLDISRGTFHDTDTSCSDTDDIDEPDCGYCVNMDGCEDDDIDTDYAECYGYFACEGAEIDSEIVYSYGYKALYDATISGADAVYAYGYMGAHEATSVTASKIDAYGIHGISKSVIYAYDDVVELSLYGYRSGYYSDVLCFDGEECKVSCGHEQGCEGLYLLCYSGSTCSFDCSDDADYCPEIYCESGAECTCEDGDDSDCDDYDTSSSSDDDNSLHDDLAIDSELTAFDLDRVFGDRQFWRASVKMSGKWVDKYDPARLLDNVDGGKMDEMNADMNANMMDLELDAIHAKKRVHDDIQLNSRLIWAIVGAFVVFSNIAFYWYLTKGKELITNKAQSVVRYT